MHYQSILSKSLKLGKYVGNPLNTKTFNLCSSQRKNTAYAPIHIVEIQKTVRKLFGVITAILSVVMSAMDFLAVHKAVILTPAQNVAQQAILGLVILIIK